MLPRDHLSPSSINMYLRCSQQFKIHYIDGLSSPPGFAMLAGDALDKAVKAEMTAKIDTGSGLSKEILYEEVARTMEEGVKALDRSDTAVIERGGPEKAVSSFLEGSGSLLDSVKPWADSYDPETVQQEVGAHIGDYPVKGFIDVTSKEGKTTDTKLWTKRKDSSAAENSNQLRLYQIMRKRGGFKNTGAEFQGWYPLKRGYQAQNLQQPESPEAEKRLEDLVWNVGKQIEAGFFPPVNLDSQNSWVCSAKYCGFWELHCSYGKRARRQV